MSNNTSYTVTTTIASPIDTQSHDKITTLEWIVYMSVMLLAVLGNMLVIVTLFTARYLGGISKYPIILNLAVCDMTSVAVSITTTLIVESLGHFSFGTIVCKIIYPLSTYGLNCIVSTLLLITLERFITIVYQYKFSTKQKLKGIITLHVISLATVLPYVMTAKVIKSNNIYECTESWDNNSSRIYTVALFLIQYGIPLPIMVILYSVTWRVIQKQNLKTINVLDKCSYSANSQSKRKRGVTPLNRGENCEKFKQNKTKKLSEVSIARRAQTKSTLKMFTGVIMVFAICMMPNQITWFYFTFKPTPLNHMFETFFYWLTYGNSVLNPWIYAGLNSRFRKAYVQIFKKLFNFLSILFTRRCMSKKYNKNRLKKYQDASILTGDSWISAYNKRISIDTNTSMHKNSSTSNHKLSLTIPITTAVHKNSFKETNNMLTIPMETNGVNQKSSNNGNVLPNIDNMPATDVFLNLDINYLEKLHTLTETVC